MLLADLDDLRTVNDSLGHAEGDEVLKTVAGRLSAELRARDTVARIGGDEFAILLEDVNLDEATLAGERIAAAFGAPLSAGGRDVTVSVSIGLAVARSGAETAEELIRHADAAMYLAKRRGQGELAVFEPALQAEADRRLDLKGDLTSALARGEFRLHYQPLVGLRDGAIAGVEALLRWQHPTR